MSEWEQAAMADRIAPVHGVLSAGWALRCEGVSSLTSLTAGGQSQVPFQQSLHVLRGGCGCALSPGLSQDWSPLRIGSHTQSETAT